ncbi:MAG: DUF362 domain-containing protein [Candidatus Neomarinimicrobiota bacterium]
MSRTKHQGMTRRDFIKGSTSAALAGALYLGTPVSLFSNETPRTRVVLVRDPAALDRLNRPNKAVLGRMLDQAVTTLTDIPEPTAAWRTLISPEDVVGIKTNVWTYLRTPLVLEELLQERVEGAGVGRRKISINDRGILSDRTFRDATALINVRPLHTHYWSGVGSLVKNYITFVPEPSVYHPDTCADLGAIWNQPHVQGRTRLNILVVLTPLFHGSGPHHFNPRYTWAYYGLLVGTDPVAVDATGVRLLQAKRKEYFGEERPLNPPPKHVFLADSRHHVGTADPANIELLKLGWQEDVLI